MHRKVHKIGSSLMVSLPASWAKGQKIDENSEVFVDEDNNFLRIAPKEKDKQDKKITLSLDTLEMPLRKKAYLRSLLGNIYKLGYDRITLTSVPTGMKSAIRKTCDNLIGFEIIDEEKNKIIIRNLSSPGEEERDQLIKKQFYATSTIMKTIKEDFDNKNKKNVADVKEFKDIVERTTDYTKRLTLQKDTELYLLIWTFEKMNRELIYLYENVSPKKVSKSIIVFMNDVFTYAENSMKNVFTFDVKNTEKLHRKKEELLYSKGAQLLKDTKTKDDKIAIHHLLNVTRRAWDAVGPMLLSSLEKTLPKN